MTDSEAEVLVRLTLFKLEPAVDAVTDEELQLVADRVKAAIHKRLHIPDDDFRIWIEDTKSSLVRSIERSLLGRLTRSQIHAVPLELAWCSVKLFAHSLDVQMRASREALPVPLSPAESFLF